MEMRITDKAQPIIALAGCVFPVSGPLQPAS